MTAKILDFPLEAVVRDVPEGASEEAVTLQKERKSEQMTDELFITFVTMLDQCDVLSNPKRDKMDVMMLRESINRLVRRSLGIEKEAIIVPFDDAALEAFRDMFATADQDIELPDFGAELENEFKKLFEKPSNENEDEDS